MINNYSQSSEGGNGRIRVYAGVASVKVLAVNPDNAKLRSLGFNIKEDAEEPKYVKVAKDADGNEHAVTTVRMMCQIQNMDDMPVISLNFPIRASVRLNRDGSKCQVIDRYGNTAWGTRDEVQAGKIPVYPSGKPADIDPDYRPCHFGEEDLIRFLMRYLCIAPYKVMDRRTGEFVRNADAGCLTIDDWQRLAGGDVSEIKSMLALLPDNKLKVILGARRADDNRVWQSFCRDNYLSNRSSPGMDGVYQAAKRIIDRVKKDGYDATEYDAHTVHLWEDSPTEVTPSMETPGMEQFSGGDPFANGAKSTGHGDDLPF